MSIGLCPNCGIKIEFTANPEIGQQTKCNNCKMELIVVWLHPIELDMLYSGELNEEEYYYDETQDYEG